MFEPITRFMTTVLPRSSCICLVWPCAAHRRRLLSDGRVARCDGRSYVYWGQNMSLVDNFLLCLVVAAYASVEFVLLHEIVV